MIGHVWKHFFSLQVITTMYLRKDIFSLENYVAASGSNNKLGKWQMIVSPQMGVAFERLLVAASARSLGPKNPHEVKQKG